MIFFVYNKEINKFILKLPNTSNKLEAILREIFMMLNLPPFSMKSHAHTKIFSLVEDSKYTMYFLRC